MRAQALAPSGILLAVLLAGCAIPGSTLDPSDTAAQAVPFEDLVSSGSAVVNDNGTVSFRFEGATSPAVGALVISERVDPTPLGTFEVDGRVGYARLEFGPAASGIFGILRDDEGRIQCVARGEGSCTAPIPEGSPKVEWALDWAASLGPTAPGSALSAIVTLHPPRDMFPGDPLAGVDTTISFRESDTGFAGSEDNIGVLGDGTIFTQKNLATLRSRDDGMTWEDVAPPLNRQESLDPMLFVDPWRDLVFVDHLYVACSQLSWSADAGSTWLQNPAACGGPANDHQKIASGPNPAPLPMPAVYYTYSSFAQGVWASRSYDGGVTWATSAPIVGVGDGREYANTGPIYADESGNVYIPLYMCDGEGYMGVGVSHDFGLTWKFVVASDEPGACTDVDPGIWSDTDGTVYLAYHRDDAIKYVYSTDLGETWSAPVAVSPPTLLSFVHVDAVAGDPGRLAIVYRATPDSAGGPDGVDGWAAWHLYVTFVENAASATPTIRTAIVNDPADPMQRGPICTNGIGCFGGSRNLLDFIDIAVGPDGRVYPTYTDGCPAEGCPTPADSRERIGLVGVQVEGPRLFVERAPWAS